MAQSPSLPISKHNTLFPATPVSSCTLFFLLILCILGLYTVTHHPHSLKTSSNTQRNNLYFRDIFLSAASNYTLSSYLRALTLHPHLAGTQPGLQTAQYVETYFKDLGLNTHMVNYETLLSYPLHASLSVQFSNGTVKELPLAEPGQVGSDVVRPYHAYSPSGSAHAKAVFANFGREEDYRALGALGVAVTGCVVLVRRGELSRGCVVELAADNGAAAVLMYTEGDDVREEGVERGTVMVGLGDPLSPGWAGIEGGESLRLDNTQVTKRFPKIPSMPISTQNAYAILGSLEGVRVPDEWMESRFRVRWVGPGPTMLNFNYQEEKKIATIHNVFAVIRGLKEPDRYVLLGNHRDAWTYGAVDPNSGTAALLDIARRYALLMRLGWNPQRTIILCSWDAEEFGMIGSTEWVEQNLLNLGSKAVAYLNVDCAVQGSGFFGRATPQLDDLLVEVTKKVQDPDSASMTVYERWTTTNRGISIQRLSGVDSDFAPFLQHAGVPSVDLYYGKDFPVYHTAFDSYSWMTNYGDPLFQRHVAVANIWGLLALHLADDPILPFSYLSYADQLQEYTNVLSKMLDSNISLNPLTLSILELASAAKLAQVEAEKVGEQGTMGDLAVLRKRAINDRLMLAERGFLDADGIQRRPWFKHLIYGPPSEYGSKLVFFPGIADAISRSTTMKTKREQQDVIQHEIWRVARAIQRAASALKGELT